MGTTSNSMTKMRPIPPLVRTLLRFSARCTPRFSITEAGMESVQRSSIQKTTKMPANIMTTARPITMTRVIPRQQHAGQSDGGYEMPQRQRGTRIHRQQYEDVPVPAAADADVSLADGTALSEVVSCNGMHDGGHGDGNRQS